MSSGTPFQPHSQENFRYWDEARAAIEPYLQALYPQVEPLLQDAETIVDLGAGEGYTHRVLSSEFSPRLTSVDLDKSALRRLRRQYPGAQTVVGDTDALPFRDESFDAAIAINGIGGDEDGIAVGAAEACRVLKPGGTLVLLHDIPSGRLYKETVSRFEDMPPHIGQGFYILPLHDPTSGNIDTFGYVPKRFVEELDATGSVAADMVLRQVEPLLGDEQWVDRIYEDKLMIATYARLFTRLVKAIQAEPAIQAPLGQPKVLVTEPMARRSQEFTLGVLEDLDGCEARVEKLEVDYETEGLHQVDGDEIASMYIDELVVPQIVFARASSQRTGTRVRGKTPVYVVRKDV